tara:strand:+ start:1581 stop:1895 length:315 start_codon:yes stop_codon:yes gene_type:complete
MDTYIKIEIINQEGIVYIPIEKIRLPFYDPGDGAAVIKVAMSGGRGDTGFYLEFDGVSTMEETENVLVELNKAIASAPARGGFVNLQGEFNKLAQVPEYTQVFG